MRERYHLLDALRGFAIYHVIVFHFLYDVYVVYGLQPDWPYQKFDKQGNIVREERNDVFNEICVESSVTAYNYDIYGNVLAEQYAEDGKHIYTCLYERDSKGKLLTEYKLNGEKLPYKYDDPSYCNMCEFVYDEFGNETEYKEYHINDLFEASLLSWEKAEYDSRGNIILLKECDDNGDVYLYEDTYAVIRNEYNHRGCSMWWALAARTRFPKPSACPRRSPCVWVWCCRRPCWGSSAGTD